MAPRFFRYLRWRLAESGFIPRSATGRVFLYLLVVDLLLYLARQLAARFVPSWEESLTALFAIITVVVSVLGTVLAVRWIRRRLLWRLRNRLFVTYTFIAVIPLLLVLLMAGIAGYLFAGQFATNLAASDIQVEVDRLAAANSAVATELSAKLQRGASGERTPELLGVMQLGELFADAEVDAWYRGRRILLSGKDQPSIAEPAWFSAPERRGRFAGIVLDEGKLYLRAITVAPVGREELLLVSSAPLDPARMAKIAESIGEIAVFGGGTFRVGSGPQQRSGANLTFETRDEQQAQQPAPQTPQENRESPQRVQVEPVSGGRIPDARHRLDRQVAFVFPLSLTRWTTGETVAVPLTVQTRLSALYDRLFLRVGGWANAIFTFLIAVGVLFAVIELIALLIGIGLTRTITGSVHKLYEATQRVNRGDFRHRIAVKSNDQLATLERSFNSMVENLEQLIAEQKEKERLQSELAIAQEVQAQLFPREITQLETFELHGICRPARIVSGDYYDFIPLGAERLGIAVGDISGKGISAALLMATLHSAVRAFEFGRIPVAAAQLVSAGSGRPKGTTQLHDIAWRAAADGHVSTAEVMSLLNHHLFVSTPQEKYATLFLSTFDGPTRQMTYTNAGHLPPLIIASDGSVRRLDEGGLVIGLFDDLAFDERTIQLHPGDIFVAYSDGITEPENEFGEFGEQRLIELVRDYRTLPLARITDHVVDAVQAWIGNAEQPDDVTLVLARAH